MTRTAIIEQIDALLPRHPEACEGPVGSEPVDAPLGERRYTGLTAKICDREALLKLGALRAELAVGIDFGVKEVEGGLEVKTFFLTVVQQLEGRTRFALESQTYLIPSELALFTK